MPEGIGYPSNGMGMMNKKPGFMSPMNPVTGDQNMMRPARQDSAMLQPMTMGIPGKMLKTGVLSNVRSMNFTGS